MAAVSEITQSFSAHLSTAFFGVVHLTGCNLDLTVTLHYAEECPVCYIILSIGFHTPSVLKQNCQTNSHFFPFNSDTADLLIADGLGQYFKVL